MEEANEPNSHAMNWQLCHAAWWGDRHHSSSGLPLILRRKFTVKSLLKILMRRLIHCPYFWYCETLHLPEMSLIFTLFYKVVVNKLDIIPCQTKNPRNTGLEHHTDEIWYKFAVTMSLTKIKVQILKTNPMNLVLLLHYFTHQGPFSCVSPVPESLITLLLWC